MTAQKLSDGPGPNRLLDEIASLTQARDPESQETAAEAIDLLLAAFRASVEAKVGDTYTLKHPVEVDGTEYKELTLAAEATTRVWTNAQIAAEHAEEVEKYVLAEMYGVPVRVIWAIWPKDSKELLRRLNHFFY